jgi:hypothetical protein
MSAKMTRSIIIYYGILMKFKNSNENNKKLKKAEHLVDKQVEIE